MDSAFFFVTIQLIKDSQAGSINKGFSIV